MGLSQAETDFSAQAQLLSYIQHFVRNSIDKVGSDKRNIEHFNSRLNLPESYWDRFFYNDIILLKYKVDDQTKNNAYFVNEHFEFGESVCIEAKTIIRGEINKLLIPSASSQSPQANLSHTNISNVPRLESHSTLQPELPKFDGSQEEWDS